MFGIRLHNIPLINLRSEFQRFAILLSQKKFRDQFEPGKEPPFNGIGGLTGGSHDTILTMILQRSISGIEAYLPAAVKVEAAIRGCLERDDANFLNNPFLLKGKSTVENYYHKLPSQLSKEIRLKVYDKDLWERNKQFYKEIRNPLFHGKEIDGHCVEGVMMSMFHIQELYNWIDSWHNPENIFKGFSDISSNPKWNT